MLFLESPSGVGFSYCENEADCWFNDEKTASDNYDAIAAFFAAYPEFATQDFYITGESYAGACGGTKRHRRHALLHLVIAL